MVENIVRNEVIACYKQLLLFSQCFTAIYISLLRQNVVLCGNGLKHCRKLVFPLSVVRIHQLFLRILSIVLQTFLFLEAFETHTHTHARTRARARARFTL